MYQAMYRNQEYRQQDVMGASPLRLVIMAYDLAIRSCEVKDFEKATKAITVLRDALNFDYPEVSMGLFRIYQWRWITSAPAIMPPPRKALVELRDAWKVTEQRLTARPQAAPVLHEFGGASRFFKFVTLSGPSSGRFAEKKTTQYRFSRC